MQKLSSRIAQRHLANAVAVVLTIGTVVLAMFIRSVAIELDYKSKCAKVKENLHAIQLAVERYSVDSPDSTYPRSLSDLKGSGYLPEMPTNPFTGLPMRCVAELTDVHKFDAGYVPPDAQPGDFMYFKRFGPQGQQRADEAPEGYSLAAYF
jgi:hypothetical protein